MTSTARQEGKDAYGEDKNIEDCPYPTDSADMAQWLEGFFEAEANDPLAPQADDDEDEDDGGEDEDDGGEDEGDGGEF